NYVPELWHRRRHCEGKPLFRKLYLYFYAPRASPPHRASIEAGAQRFSTMFDYRHTSNHSTRIPLALQQNPTQHLLLFSACSPGLFPQSPAPNPHLPSARLPPHETAPAARDAEEEEE